MYQLLQILELEVSPKNFDVVTIVDLQHDTTSLRADQLIIKLHHSLAVKPCLYLVTLNL
jgi:hypothetical protein